MDLNRKLIKHKTVLIMLNMPLFLSILLIFSITATAQKFTFTTIQEALDDDQWNALRTHCHRLDPVAINTEFRPVPISEIGLRRYLSVKGKLTKAATPTTYVGINIDDASGKNILHLSLRPSRREVLVNNKFTGVFSQQNFIELDGQIAIGREIVIDILYREGGGRMPRFMVSVGSRPFETILLPETASTPKLFHLYGPLELSEYCV